MTTVCIITALPAEARIFIDTLKLRHVPVRGLRLYAAEPHMLLQTGIGKLQAAATTAALLQMRPDISFIINVGIAGGTHAVGQVRLAHRIIDAGSGRRWYPHLPPARTLGALGSSDVLSHDQPSRDYRPDALFDMEAAGIASAASPYLSSDAVQVVKVISDNHEQSLDRVSATQTSELMPACLPPVQAMANWHLSTANENDSAGEIEALCEQITRQLRHSVSDGHQLRQLLQRYHARTKGLPDSTSLASSASARELRHHLTRLVADTPFRYEA